MRLRILSSILLFAATTTLAFAGHAPIKSAGCCCAPGKYYVGILGGWGSSNNFCASQYGTAFFLEEIGGPLAVNAFGEIDNHNPSFFGVQLGYQAQKRGFNLCSRWTLGSGAELEAYSMNRNSFEGLLINDNEVRLPEHDFLVSYPMRRTVFLTNAVLSFNNPCFFLHPYIGLGIGSAIVKISCADATQINPPEEGINHYNASTCDTDSTFAGQIKLGLSYDINPCLSLFAEYRWLYLANTHFVFGSTVYPNHAETSSWQVNLDAQKYNLGTIGLRFNW